MSDLYRSALSARISKLPDLPPSNDDEEDDESEEAADSIGSLPGNEAVQVSVASRSLDCRVYYTPPAFADGTVMICHHGAGYSGLTFACFAKEIADMTKGKTTSTSEKPDEDLSIDILTADLIEVIQSVFPDPAIAPSLLLIGHSMGGSVVVRCCSILLGREYRVTGVAVLDVVEGSAVEALPHMHTLLNARPDGFSSIEDAIEWHVSTNTIRNAHSARVSVPSIIVPDPKGVLPYTWHTPLRSTAPYWMSWFKGLSSTFLQARTARLLVLAGTDRLDNELMIGQMQGKFQMAVVPGVGHMLQEDDPTRLAEIMVEFWRRNDRVIVGVKKVGDA
ncbi:hypothetical protein D9615_005753 [Tricholomella constricta]|uniref:Protein phosphatase methylesterase 1 n=1 Tax=Tricholomella constricta TaxID=117010 RepID=A0A8H5M3N8_9AGAR|nr:hypothetical protein D9615_005753 [Tricholomella constricta]